jgi:lipoprotein-releasing system ATP-binding protein
MLRADCVKKVYTHESVANTVLQHVSYAFDVRFSYAVTGVSGTGKSTLMHILAGIDAPTSGHVFYNDIDVYHMSIAARDAFLNQTVGLVFQDPRLINEFSVVENVMMKGLIMGQRYNDARERALSLLSMVNLEHKAFDHPLSLSGGEQQRVAVLRALYNRPVFLLADEPTGNLDADNARVLVEVLLETKRLGTGLIICSHDPFVAQVMDVRLKLQHGTLVKQD